MKVLLLYAIMMTLPLYSKGWQKDQEHVILRDHFHYNIDDVDLLEAEINFKMGELELSSNTASAFDGYTEYSPHYFRSPDVDYTVRGNNGILEIRTNSLEREEFSFSWEKEQFHHASEFKLPMGVLTELNLEFGMGEANIDLTGLQVQKLNVECGMGELDLNVDSKNPVICRDIIIEAGMGEFEGTGIGLLQPEAISIEVGMGAAMIDLSDPVEHDMEIEVEVGLGSIEFLLPENVNISAKVHDHFLSSVEMEGVIKRKNKYISEKWDNSQPTITLDISVGLGSIEVDLVD